MIKNTKNVYLIVDLQYGSTGKGLIAGYLAETREPDVVVNANMPNAGHTYIDNDGRTWVHKVLPNGIVSPKLKHVLIGPGSVFCPERLMEEINNSMDIFQESGAKLLIHPNAVPLVPAHKEAEGAANMNERIGSTSQGSSAAMIEKIHRNPNNPVTCGQLLDHMDKGIKPGNWEPDFKDWTDYICNVQEYREVLACADLIQAEGAQGYSLGINQHFYPYTTSRDCTPARFMADMAIPLPKLAEVIGTCRTYPIRVAGNSGDCYIDQQELSWEDIGVEPEKTTVTKKVRRVFTFSNVQMIDAIWECAPDKIFLNFVNYLDSGKVQNMVDTINTISRELGYNSHPVTWVGTGPKMDDVIPVSIDYGVKHV